MERERKGDDGRGRERWETLEEDGTGRKTVREVLKMLRVGRRCLEREKERKTKKLLSEMKK